MLLGHPFCRLSDLSFYRICGLYSFILSVGEMVYDACFAGVKFDVVYLCSNSCPICSFSPLSAERNITFYAVRHCWEDEAFFTSLRENGYRTADG